MFVRLLHPLLFVAVLASSGSVFSAIDLDINGVDAEVEENIRLHLASWDSLPADTAEGLGDELQPDIEKALQAFGYYGAQINYQLQDQELRLDIEPGAAVVWHTVNIQILQGDKPAADFVDLSRSHPFIAGERLQHQHYENYKRRLLNTANDLGYLDAQLKKSQLRINPQQGVADVELIMEVGGRYKIGDVVLLNSEISQDLTDILIDTQQGDWFSANLVGDVYNRLLNSGYFDSINITLIKQAPDIANLEIDVVDAAEHDVATGFGFGTDTGPRFQLKWHRPHTNTRGNSLQSNLQISQVQQSLSSRYSIPWNHPQNRYISWDTGYRRKTVEETVTQDLTTGLVYNLVRETGWQYSAGANLISERSESIDVTEKDTYVIPSAQASKRSITGDPNNPNFAYKYWLDVANSFDLLGSNTDFFRISGGFNWLFHLSNKHSFVSRAEIGVITSDVFLDVPRSQRFLTGGDQSIRGYKFETVSPLDEQGEPIGGEMFSAASIEYRYNVLREWQAAVFVDSGRSYVDREDCPTCLDTGEDYRTSAGLGVRWLSPVGFIAVDVAFPLEAVGGAEERDDPRLHIYLGTPL